MLQPEVAVLRRGNPRPRLVDRAILASLSRRLPGKHRLIMPATVLRRHRPWSPGGRTYPNFLWVSL